MAKSGSNAEEVFNTLMPVACVLVGVGVAIFATFHLGIAVGAACMVGWLAAK